MLTRQPFSDAEAFYRPTSQHVSITTQRNETSVSSSQPTPRANAGNVVQNVKQIAASILPNGSSNVYFPQACNAALRILNSNIGYESNDDIQRITERLQKKISNDKEKGIQSATKFGLLVQRLSEYSQVLPKQEKILSVLERMYNRGKRTRPHIGTLDGSTSSVLSKRVSSEISKETKKTEKEKLHSAQMRKRVRSDARDPSFQSVNESEVGRSFVHKDGVVKEPDSFFVQENAVSFPSVKARFAQMVEELYFGNVNLSPSELMHGCVFALQGIDSDVIKFSKSEDCFVINPKFIVPHRVRDFTSAVCECGWLYTKVANYIRSKPIGLVAQAFCCALEREIAEYVRLLSVLDSQELPTQSTEHSQPLSLHRLLVWLQEPKKRLTVLALLVDAAKGLIGGKLASALHSLAQHGDSFVSGLVNHINEKASSPLFVMMFEFAHEGRILDPLATELDEKKSNEMDLDTSAEKKTLYYDKGEFFVAKAQDVPLNDWEHSFILNANMIPNFIPMDVAKQILIIGKSILFLQSCCGMRISVSTSSALSIDSFAYGKVSELRNALRKIAKSTNKILVDVICGTTVSVQTKQFDLLKHCNALHRYLFLAQGDFIQCLLELMWDHLSQPANSLYRHNLVELLESAIRSSSAQFDDDDVKERIDIQLEENSEKGANGWDIFSLDYHITAPIDSVITADAMKQYLSIFSFLFKIKRVEHTLTTIWKELTFGNHEFRIIALKEFHRDLHITRMICNEMYHFLNNIQHYINFEVLQSSWTQLEKDVLSAEDLDELISSHRKYLSNVREGLMLKSTHSRKNFVRDMIELFEFVTMFGVIQSQFFTVAEDEIQRLAALEDLRRKRKREGNLELFEEELRKSETNSPLYIRLSDLRMKRNKVFNDWRESLQKFHSSLEERVEEDPALQALFSRLDFNQFYSRLLATNTVDARESFVTDDN